jgi:hypothetical protein
MPDHVLNYIECDAAAGLTLVEWRRSHSTTRRRRRLNLRVLIPTRRPPAFAV